MVVPTIPMRIVTYVASIRRVGTTRLRPTSPQSGAASQAATG